MRSVAMMCCATCAGCGVELRCDSNALPMFSAAYPIHALLAHHSTLALGGAAHLVVVVALRLVQPVLVLAPQPLLQLPASIRSFDAMRLGVTAGR